MRPYGTLRTLFENSRYWEVGLPREESRAPSSQGKPSRCTSGIRWSEEKNDALHQVQASDTGCGEEVGIREYILSFHYILIVFKRSASF